MTTVVADCRETTHYAEGLRRPDRPALTGTVTVDAVVVGAGYAGVSAALAFLDAGKSVIVLERDHVAAGASGRNGGILLLSEGTHLGDDDAAGAVDEVLGSTARELVDLVDQRGLDVGLRQGSIRLAITDRQARQLARSAGSGSAARTFLDRHALREHVRSDRYTGGLLEPDTVSLDPHRLLEALAAGAEERGAVIAEGSPVIRITADRDRWVVSTPGGEVRTGRLVVAAGTGTGEVVPAAGRLLFTGYSQIAVTEPIDPGLLDAVLPTWAATSEIAAFSRYFRRLPEDRLLFGISTLFDSLPAAELEGELRRQLADTFPELAHARLSSAWEGSVASTVTEAPLLQRLGSSGVVTSSNGVLGSYHVGRVAAAATAPEFAAYEELRKGRHLSWPPLHLPDRWVRYVGRRVFAWKDTW